MDIATFRLKTWFQAWMLSEVWGIISWWLRCTAHCSLHTAHCTIHTAHCMMNTAHYTLYSTQFIIHKAYCKLPTTHLTQKTAVNHRRDKDQEDIVDNNNEALFKRIFNITKSNTSVKVVLGVMECVHKTAVHFLKLFCFADTAPLCNQVTQNLQSWYNNLTVLYLNNNTGTSKCSNFCGTKYGHKCHPIFPCPPYLQRTRGDLSKSHGSGFVRRWASKLTGTLVIWDKHHTISYLRRCFNCSKQLWLTEIQSSGAPFTFAKANVFTTIMASKPRLWKYLAHPSLTLSMR